MKQQHVEFFDRDHFEYNYFRKKAKGELARFIDYFWETDFDALYTKYPTGFSDALFPNLGYTYIMNLGTPCVMQLDDKQFELKTDCFLPRNCNMICHHSKGNKLFGIKFKVSPVVFEKKVDFSEYKNYIFPLAYLMDRNVINLLKEAGGFDKRVQIVSEHYNKIIKQHAGSLEYIDIVTDILDSYYTDHDFGLSIEDLAAKHKITSRTLQRYFEKATSISSKQALQIIRIRKAVEHLVTDPSTFNFEVYGYYDHSHFYKHLKQFVSRTNINIDEPHLKLLHLQNKKKAP
jgi:AraC-like DNA-binding protein